MTFLKSARYLVRTGRCYAWPTLLKNDGDELFDHYRHTLENLGNEKGLLGLIFNKSQNQFRDPRR